MEKKIIYIIGAGRSGTTLLEIMIGNGRNIFNCGELNRFPKRKGVPPLYPETSKKFLFWKKIFTSMECSKSELIEQEVFHKKYEYHLGFIKQFFSSSKNEAHKAYKNFLDKLYNSIFENIKEDIITDSSKYPGRAYQLSSTLGKYDISYIYIKRDPVDVIQSFRKKQIEQPSKNWLSANLYYFIVNFLCKLSIFILKDKHKIIEIKYEDLVNNPVDTMLKIEEKLDINLSNTIDKIKRKEPLQIGYLFDGNRIRLNENLKEIKKRKVTKLKTVDSFTRLVNFFLYS